MVYMDILGYELFSEGFDTLMNELSVVLLNDGSCKSDCCWFTCLNPHSYVVASKDEEFSSSLLASDWIIPDGIGIVIASKALKKNLRERLTGYDIFVGVNSLLNKSGGSVYFLGGSEETLKKISHRIAKDYPNLRIAGMYSPPYCDRLSAKESDKILTKINSATPDVLWVAMSAPKQEKWIYENISQINARLAGPIGAVFDFYGGDVARSSKLFRCTGLEWLPRLIQEPKRLWRRTFISGPIFLGHLIKAVFSSSKKP